MESVVRLEGAVKMTLEKLIDLGYFKTRNEAIRAGILELGKKYSMKINAQDIEDELAVRKMKKISREIDEGKRKIIPLDDVLKQHGIERSDLD